MSSLYELFSGGLTAQEHRKKSKYKALQQRKNPTAKEDILPVLEIITGASASGERGKSGTLMEAALATPVIGHVGRGIKGTRLLGKIFKNWKSDSFGKQVFSQAKYSGVGPYQAKNQEIIHHLKKADWREIGKTRSGFKSLEGGVTVSVPDKPIGKIAGREVSAVMYDTKQGSVIQPFYKSSGRGEPTMKSHGKWLPFEGVHTSAARVEGLDVIGKHGKTKDWSMADRGWFVKGFKKPGEMGKVFDTSSAGRMKRGLPIHEETTELLKQYYK